MRKAVLAGSAILLLAIILALSIYRVSFNSDDYNILLINRRSGLGYGIVCKDKFEIWQIAKTVHGGMAERPLYYEGRWWGKEEKPTVYWGKIEVALYEQLKAENRFKSDAEIHQAIGYSLLESDNQWERAVVHFKKAVQEDPGLYFSWYNLGLIYADEEEGRDYFRKCIKANPDFAPAYYWLGYSLCRHRRDKEALPVFEEYLKVAEDDPQEKGRLEFAGKLVRELRAGQEGESLKMIRIPE
jgi:tetratricopeptide (TPR) repeat protein